MIDYRDITAALQRLGVKKGDICLFHSSFKSLGPVDGGAVAVIRGFEEAVGEEGTVVVPTLCSQDFENSYKTWHLDKPSDVGYLTEYFRKLPGSLRSDHATHSVAARGKLALELTKEHAAFGPHYCPFGEYAFADSSPWTKMYRYNAKIVFLGVNMRYNTMKHMIEGWFVDQVLAACPEEKRQAQLDKLVFFGKDGGVRMFVNMVKMQAHFENLGLVRQTTCGDATLLCIDAKPCHDIMLEAALNHPELCFDEARIQWINDCK